MSVSMIIALLPVLAIIIFVFVRSWALSRKQSEEMVCGGCGYSVRGAANFTCPECGGDLRTVGIVGEDTHRQTTSVRKGRLAIILAVAAVLVAGLVASGIAYRSAKRQQATATQRAAVALRALQATQSLYATPTPSPIQNKQGAREPQADETAVDSATSQPSPGQKPDR